jgi:hypothetical protein
MANVVIMANFNGIVVGFKRQVDSQLRTAEGTTGLETPRGQEAGKKQRALSEEKDQRVLARIAFAGLLQQIYKSEGRLIAVQATGDRRQTLELSSDLIFKGSNTLDAARRETILCDSCMTLMRKDGFTQILIHGSDYSESWPVK